MAFNDVTPPPWDPDGEQNAAGAALGHTLGRLFRVVYSAALGAVTAVAWKRHYDHNGGDLVDATKQAARSWLNWLLWGGAMLWTGFYLLSGVYLPIMFTLSFRREQAAASRVTGYELTQVAAVHHGQGASTVIAYVVYLAVILVFLVPFCLGTLYVRNVDSSLFVQRRLYRWALPFARSVTWPSWVLYLSAYFGPGLVFGLTAAVVRQIIH